MSGALTIRVLGADEVGRDLANLGLRANVRAAEKVRHYGMLYQTRVKAHASGRPGPKAVTGDYRRSIYFEMTSYAGGPAAVVGTNAPQGRRLEYGFVGADSLGRVYDQPPYPHFDPPLEAIVAELTVALAEAVT